MKSRQSTNAFVKETFMDLKIQLETVAKNHLASIQNLETKFDRLADKQSGRPSGSLPWQTQIILKGTYSLKLINHRNLAMSIDDENEEPSPQLKTQNPKPVKETPLPKPYKRNPYPQCLWKEKCEKILKELINNKHKIEQISAAFLSDESSAMIQNKVPPKLEDSESFLIPCNFNKTFSCNALADLDHGIAENMLVEVGKFTFPADFVILKMEEDSKVPLILGRPFLHTADAVIRVKQKQLNLGVRTERMIKQSIQI
ncbi:reverse transcriptase domain-containing protein [Tanacetum coccineum]